MRTPPPPRRRLSNERITAPPPFTAPLPFTAPPPVSPPQSVAQSTGSPPVNPAQPVGQLPLKERINLTNSRFLSMNEEGFTLPSSPITILTSGGAADCLIIAAYSTNTPHWTYIVHADRTTSLEDVRQRILGLGKPVNVHLCSTSFTNDPKNKIALEAMRLFEKAGFEISIHSSRKLAIDSTSGEVTTDFEPSDCTPANSVFQLRATARKVTKRFTVSQQKFERFDNVRSPNESSEKEEKSVKESSEKEKEKWENRWSGNTSLVNTIPTKVYDFSGTSKYETIINC